MTNEQLNEHISKFSKEVFLEDNIKEEIIFILGHIQLINQFYNNPKLEPIASGLVNLSNDLSDRLKELFLKYYKVEKINEYK